MTPLKWLQEFQVNIIDTGIPAQFSNQHGSQITQLSNGNILVVWTSDTTTPFGPGSDGNSNIIGRIFDPVGNPITDELALSTVATNSAETRADVVALDGGGFMLTYQSVDVSLPNSSFGIFADVFDNSGSHQRLITIQQLQTQDRWANPEIASVNATNALITYYDGNDLFGSIVNPSTGAIIVDEFVIADEDATLAFTSSESDAMVTGTGDYAVVWVDRDVATGDDELKFKFLNTGGVQFATTKIIPTTASDIASPTISLIGSSFGSFVVAWETNNSSFSNAGIRFQVFDLGGGELTNVINPLTSGAGDQTNPDVLGLSDGGFVLSWIDAATNDLIARRFNTDGTTNGDEFIVENLNSFTLESVQMEELEDGRIAFSFSRTESYGDSDTFMSIWDPRDAVNDTPLYDDQYIIGTPQNDGIVPVPAGAQNVVGSFGNDIFWTAPPNNGIVADYDGGAGYDTLGALGPGTYTFAGNTLTSIEQFKFNAGGSNGLKTVIMTPDIAESFQRIDFAQGGATKEDVLHISLSALDTTVDLSGVTITDFESEHDTLLFLGSTGDDTIVGSQVDDLIRGDAGTDNMDGGLGNDTLDFQNSGYTGTLSVNLETGVINGSQGAETADNFENVIGSDLNDALQGTNGVNILIGNGGDNSFYGRDGADVTVGGSGKDTFFISRSNVQGGVETIDGNGGIDNITILNDVGDFSNQTTVLSGASIESVEELRFGGTAAIQYNLFATFQANQLGDGQFASDLAVTGRNIAGQTERITILMNEVSTIDLDDWTFSDWGGQGELVRIIGDNDGEKIVGSSEDDYIQTFGGDDIITAFGGSDLIESGDDDDEISINGLGDTVDAGSGNDVVRLIDFNTNVAHKLDGGGGGDTLDFSAFTNHYAVDLQAETFIRKSGSENVTDVLVNFEDVFGGSGNDDIAGNGQANTIFGGLGNDLLEGRGGEDELYAGSGNDDLDGGVGADIMVGGLGNDEYFVDDVADTTIEGENQGYERVFVDGLASWTLSAHTERLTFTDTGNHTGKGNELNNRLDGNAGADKFLLDSGGADIFSGGSGSDSFDARHSTNGISINFITGEHGGDAEGDTFSSMEKIFGSDTKDDFMRTGAARADFSGFGGDDTLVGGNSIDKVNGNDGNDDLYGGAARDTLNGGTGNDTMNGGSGADIFLYVDADFGQDTITDWQDGVDKFRFYSAVATEFSDFTVTGNGTSTARITLNSDTSNFVDIEGSAGSIVSIDGSDFLFY